MDRSVLDALYAARPQIAFRKAFAEQPLDPSTCRFLRDHACDLTLDQLRELLQRGRVRDDKWPGVAPFVEALAERLAEACAGDARRHIMVPLGHVLELAPTNPRSWLDEAAWRVLVSITRARLPLRVWWWLVERARGCAIFNALSSAAVPFPDQGTVQFDSIQETRPEPLVVPLLDDPLNERSAVAYLFTLPMRVVVDVMAKVPELVPRGDVEAAAEARIREPLAHDDWSTPLLPEWLAPYVVKRARTCDDLEAFTLYAWLEKIATEPEDALLVGRSSSSTSSRSPTPDELFGLAMARLDDALAAQVRLGDEPEGLAKTQRALGLNRVVYGWCLALARRLTTGEAWKENGRRMIAWCIDRGGIFPEATLHAALGFTSERDGSSTEDHRQAILRKAHDVAGRLFVDRAEAAMRAGDWERAERLLDAFATLEPGKFLRGRIHHLRSIEGAERLAARLDACDSLLKAGGRTSTADDFLYAFRVLGGTP